MGEEITFTLLLLIIPKEHVGALETFLLDAIKKQDAYDGKMIDKGHVFVQNVDPEKRYLKHRGQKIKAEFDVYFSIRTTSKQFGERRNIIKSVPWEEFASVQDQFAILGTL